MKALRTVVVVVVVAFVLGPVGMSFVAGQAQKDKDPKAQKEKPKDNKAAQAGTVFELYKDKSGEFRFRLKDEFGILAISGKGYETKADAQKVIETIRREAAKARLDDQAK
jgi:uncharacterized protein YegP (UPF0339 family)